MKERTAELVSTPGYVSKGALEVRANNGIAG